MCERFKVDLINYEDKVFKLVRLCKKPFRHQSDICIEHIDKLHSDLDTDISYHENLCGHSTPKEVGIDWLDQQNKTILLMKKLLNILMSLYSEFTLLRDEKDMFVQHRANIVTSVKEALLILTDVDELLVYRRKFDRLFF